MSDLGWGGGSWKPCPHCGKCTEGMTDHLADKHDIMSKRRRKRIEKSDRRAALAPDERK